MSTGLIIVIVVVVVLVVAAAILLPGQLRSRRLRNRFGPEYDRTIANTEDRRDAERELAEREQRHAKYELRELTPAARNAYLDRWSEIQEQFVDEPAAAVNEADVLVTDVMKDLGYPADDFDQQAKDLSVRYADDVERYRTAHQLAATADTAATDDLRKALLDYRELVRSLLGDQEKTNA
jgi:acyl-CoA reductase-like NAD-dependent aldehyde dehydrogenase